VTAYRKSDIDESTAELHRLLDDHDGYVYVIIRRVSASGMTRWITPLIFVDGEPRYLGYHVARVLGAGLDNDRGVRVVGCGMDMGWHLIYSLSTALYGHKDDAGYRLKHRQL
jgi:hypothetical protein